MFHVYYDVTLNSYYTDVYIAGKYIKQAGDWQYLGFPTAGSFCKTGFSVLGKVKTGFRVRFWKWRHCVHCESAGGLGL